MKYLNRREGHTVEKVENGIYYVRGSLVPIQIIVLNQLPAGKNLWLRVLTNNLREKNVARRMLTEYETHRNNALYSSVLDVVVKANEKVFKQEDNNMCELLEQIINEKMEKKLAAIEAAEAAARTAEANARAAVKAAEAATAEAAEKAEKALLKGRNEGMKQGRLQVQQHTAFNLKKINFSVEQIASVVEESVETITAWLAEA